MVDTLIVVRSHGRSVYPITRATWNLYHDSESGRPNLCLRVRASRDLVDATNDEEPWWEVNLIETGLQISSLVPAAEFTVPLGYDEARGGYVTNLYNQSVHAQTDQNVIQIVEVDGDRLRVRLDGLTIDCTYHEKSGTRHTYASVSLEAWFTHYSDGHRSFA